MSEHFLPMVTEVRVYKKGDFENRSHYDVCFNLSITGKTAYISGVDKPIHHKTIRSVLEWLEKYDVDTLQFERRGQLRSYDVKSKHKKPTNPPSIDIVE